MQDLVVRIARRCLTTQPVQRLEQRLLRPRPFERMVLPSSPALTITCDDGARQTLDVVDALAAKGVKCVIGVSPELIDHSDQMDAHSLRELRRCGHEMAFHGLSDRSFVTYASADALARANHKGIARMVEEELGRPTTVLYPYGDHNRWVRTVVSRSFACAFSTWYGLNERAEENIFALRRVPFGAYAGRLPASEVWYRSLIDRAALGGAIWPVLMLHPGCEEHTMVHTRLLVRLVEYAQDHGVKVVTVQEHLDPLCSKPRSLMSESESGPHR